MDLQPHWSGRMIVGPKVYILGLELSPTFDENLIREEVIERQERQLKPFEESHQPFVQSMWQCDCPVMGETALHNLRRSAPIPQLFLNGTSPKGPSKAVSHKRNAKLLWRIRQIFTLEILRLILYLSPLLTNDHTGGVPQLSNAVTYRKDVCASPKGPRPTIETYIQEI